MCGLTYWPNNTQKTTLKTAAVQNWNCGRPVNWTVCFARRVEVLHARAQSKFGTQQLSNISHTHVSCEVAAHQPFNWIIFHGFRVFVVTHDEWRC